MARDATQVRYPAAPHPERRFRVVWQQPGASRRNETHDVGNIDHHRSGELSRMAMRAAVLPTRPPTTIPVHFKIFFTIELHKMLTIPRRKTQHLVVHRFARERDEKGMR